MRRFLLVASVLLAACVSNVMDVADEDLPPLKSVGYVDLDRYLGRWYLMANIPYFAERGNLAPHVDYSRRPDGLIADRLEAQESFDQPPFVRDGVIEILNPMTNAEGRVTFLVPLWQDFAVLYLDEDYRYTLVGHPSRNYCWIFAREPVLPDDVYQKMRRILAANGFDASRVMRIAHRPEEIGLPGYQ